MDILLKVWKLTELIVQPNLAHYIGLIPVLRNLPTLRDHALGSEIDHVLRLEFLGKGNKLIELFVEVNLSKSKVFGT